jgi:hypothetical protein
VRLVISEAKETASSAVHEPTSVLCNLVSYDLLRLDMKSSLHTCCHPEALGAILFVHIVGKRDWRIVGHGITVYTSSSVKQVKRWVSCVRGGVG